MTAPKLFEPLALSRSNLRLVNRLVMAPMPTFAANADGSVGAEELAYYARRSQNLGALITAGCAVSLEGVCFDGQWRCDNDAFIPSLKSAAAAIRPAVAVLQLCHGGNLSDPLDAIKLIDDFAAGARRAQQAGFEVVEIHGGHRYLLHQLFSRRNQTPGPWGGPTVVERARLLLAIVEAVSRFLPCWYRLDPEEDGPQGILFDETVELAHLLAAAGVEVFDVSAKRYAQGSILPPAGDRPRAALLAASLSGQALVLGVGGIETLEQATAVLHDGCALVGLGSVLLAHPDWPAAARQGKNPSSPAEKPSSDTLGSLAVPAPVVRYLAKRGRLSDD